jgi:hypothetical protein
MILFYHKTREIKAALEGRGFRPKFFGKLWFIFSMNSSNKIGDVLALTVH